MPKIKGDYLIFDFTSETEDYDWEEGEGYLLPLISLRSDLIRGDYLCLYLAWLFCAQMGEIEDDEEEPPVPANLGNLNASLESFADFMRLDMKKVDSLILTKKPKAYDEAVILLIDLKDLAKKNNTTSMFKSKLMAIRENHSRKSSFINRIDSASL